MIDFKLNKELVVSFAFFILVVLFGSWSIIALTPLVFVILYKLFENKKLGYSIMLLDLPFVLIISSEILTQLFSINTSNNSTTDFNLYVIVFLYIAYRRYFISPQKKSLFSIALFFLTVFLAISTILYFLIYYNTLLNKGITDLNNYKALYNPFGVWNNLWASILLLLIPFTLVFITDSKKIKIKILGLLVVLLLIFGVVISFSRGIYLSFIFFIITLNILIFRYFKLKQLLIYNGIMLFMFVIPISVAKNSVVTTFSFNKTVSQQRSTTSRINRWKNTLPLIIDNPILGRGNNSFVFSKNKALVGAEDASFSSKIDNTYLQILLEKGFLGFLGYFYLFVVCSYITYKGLKRKTNTKKQKLELAIIFSGLIAFSIRETTFSSFFSNNTVYFLLFHLVFFLIPYDIELKKISISQKPKNIILLVLLFITSFIAYTYIKNKNLNSYNNKFIKAFYKNERLEAFDFLNKSIKLSPNNIILSKNKTLLLSKKTIQIDISSKYNNLFTIKHLDRDTLKVVKKTLKKLLKLNPYDDETYHNLGWVYLALNKMDSSKICFRNAIAQNPYNSTYLISNILYNIKKNDYKNIVSDLSKTLRYSPEILESNFYREFTIKYKAIAISAEKKAILGLQNNLGNGDNPILKARLARLLLKKDSIKSLKLLEEVTTSLPNLSRPWLYKAFLHERVGDTIIAKRNYEKAIFLKRSDFLPKLYYANFLKSIGKNKKSITLYRETLQSYSLIKSETYLRNKTTSNLQTIQNSYIPNDLLYYVKPTIPYNNIFDYFIRYYESINNVKLQKYYKQLSEKYKKQVYKGNELLK